MSVELRGSGPKYTVDDTVKRVRDGRTVQTFVGQFSETMPRRYLARYSPTAVRAHARIAEQRAGKPAHVGRFTSDSGEWALCVVAPDALGLLAAISASLMLDGFDIMQAEAYTRRTHDGALEAVDLFWVRRERYHQQIALTDSDAKAVASTLIEILNGSRSLRAPGRSSSYSTPGAAETTVHFLEHASDPYLTLELETNDRPGLLLAVTTALFAEGVLITGSRVNTRGRRVHDAFELVEADGSRICGDRLQRIQLAVLGAVDNPDGGRGYAFERSQRPKVVDP